MKLLVEYETTILSPVNEVFEAIVNPEKMSKYFISRSSGKMEAGKTVTWRWDDVGAELPVTVKAVDLDRGLLSFLWSASGVETLVEFDLEPLDGTTTRVKVREDGWEIDEEGIKQYGQQTQGWVDMVTCLKGYLEFGVNLRTGKQPITVPDLSNRPFDLKVERLMETTPEIIYQAWTEKFDTWFAAPGTLLMKAEVDSVFFFETIYRIETPGVEERHPHYGRFLRLVKDRLIELTWLTGAAGTKGAETVVTIELEPYGTGTKISLSHKGFPDEQSKIQHENAWVLILEQLDQKLMDTHR